MHLCRAFLFVIYMRILILILLSIFAYTASAQSYYWQSGKKKKHYKYLTLGGGIGTRMFFGDVQTTSSLFNKLTFAYQTDLRYQWKRNIGIVIQGGGRSFKGKKKYAQPETGQVMSGKLWEGEVAIQYSVLRWEDFLKGSFVGYDDYVRFNTYIGAGVGGSLYNTSTETSLLVSTGVDSTSIVTNSASASGMGVFIPIQLGVRYRFTTAISINLEFQYQFYFTDKLDAIERRKSDNMGLTILKIGYSFGQPNKHI